MRTATFALFIGIAYLSAGFLGMVPAALMPVPADAPPTQLTVLYGYLLGVFPVNVLHSAVHLAIGALGVGAWQADHGHGRITSPKMYARGLAIFYGALAVLGVIPATNTLFGMVPIHGHDVWLHAGTAALAGYFGWRSENYLERRADVGTDRREQALPVEHERRRGHSDRR
ncbi:MAG TPA: DUF4383 domain-containing protein, partial [Burkholderiales bacterium]|nr:DUF4383 domain-containing protein [Burkholderiales bacterium]